MVKLATRAIIALVCIIGVWLIFKQFEGERFQTVAYEQKIDSLGVEIKGLHQQNDSLETTDHRRRKKEPRINSKSKHFKRQLKKLKRRQF